MIEYCEFVNKDIVLKRRERICRKARALYAPHPWIPAAFRSIARDLSVVLLFRIAVDGTCVPELLRSSGYSAVDAAVLDSVIRWRFVPATIDGRPSASFLQTRISFLPE